MGWVLVIALCVAGCGRFGFEAGSSIDALDSDGAQTDGAQSDGVHSDAAPGTCDPPRKLCDGFEGSTLDPRWMSAGTITLDSTRVHRGTTSLHAHTNALAIGQDGFATIWETMIMPQGDATLYVRVFAQFDEMPLNNVGMISAIQSVGNDQIGVFLVPTGMTVYSQFDERTNETLNPPPLSTWLCLQWKIVRSQTNGSLSLSGDAGTAALTNVQTEGNSGLVELEMGMTFAGTSVDTPQPAMDIWYDDLIVSTMPITCAE